MNTFQPDIQNLFRFQAFLRKFQSVKRVILKQDSEEYENDAEHTHQLLMLAWYLIEVHGWSLDLFLVLKYILVHDLVEAYAGDTYIFGSEEDLASKHQREAEALQKITDEFPEFPSMADYIKAYEMREDMEAQFVYALDKLAGPLNIYIDNGRLWVRDGITFEQIIDNKSAKIAISPEIDAYWQQLVAIMEPEQERLFSQDGIPLKS